MIYHQEITLGWFCSKRFGWNWTQREFREPNYVKRWEHFTYFRTCAPWTLAQQIKSRWLVYSFSESHDCPPPPASLRQRCSSFPWREMFSTLDWTPLSLYHTAWTFIDGVVLNNVSTLKGFGTSSIWDNEFKKQWAILNSTRERLQHRLDVCRATHGAHVELG